MAKIQFGTTIRLAHAADLLRETGSDVTYVFEGEPGIGKSSIMFALEKTWGSSWGYSYIDCTQLDLGDIAMPRVVEENGVWVTKYAANARFGLQTGKKLVIMLDEVTKANQAVKNMLMPLMLERRLGDQFLPEGSIVFATGNLSTDGVGDSLGGHGRSRVTAVRVEKPKAFDINKESGSQEPGEWGTWAMNNGVPMEIIAWARDYPQAFASYTEGGQNDNLYIYQPKKQQQAYVCPRSLAKAGYIVSARKKLGVDVMIAALAGCIGEAAARDLIAYTTLADKLPGFDRIVNDPKKCPVPDDPAAMVMICFNLAQNAAKNNFDAIMTYLLRMKPEVQALFAMSIMKSERRPIAATNDKFTKYALDNNFIFS